MVYPAGVQNPSPIRTISQGFTLIGGVAVDTSGNVYIANSPSEGGSGAPEVIELTSEGSSLVQVFSQGLHEPTNVTVDSNGTVYVADQDSANSAIVEYAPTGGAPIATITTPNGRSDPPRSVAVDASGDLFITESGVNNACWGPIACSCEAASGVYEYPYGGTGWTQLPQVAAQPWGLAISPITQIMYQSDHCTNTIFTFNPPGYAPPAGSVPGTFNEPVYSTVSSDGLLSVPNAGVGGNGYATIMNPAGTKPPIIITNGLQGPIGAAAGP